MVALMGVEPTLVSLKTSVPGPLEDNAINFLVHLEGIEPPSPALRRRGSVQLSYRYISYSGSPGGICTHVPRLERAEFLLLNYRAIKIQDAVLFFDKKINCCMRLKWWENRDSNPELRFRRAT